MGRSNRSSSGGGGIIEEASDVSERHPLGLPLAALLFLERRGNDEGNLGLTTSLGLVGVTATWWRRRRRRRRRDILLVTVVGSGGSGSVTATGFHLWRI